ncbi:MAG: hypothetical protein AAFP69_22550, partial [Planctomycetota bacterium]
GVDKEHGVLASTVNPADLFGDDFFAEEETLPMGIASPTGGGEIDVHQEVALHREIVSLSLAAAVVACIIDAPAANSTHAPGTETDDPTLRLFDEGPSNESSTSPIAESVDEPVGESELAAPQSAPAESQDHASSAPEREAEGDERRQRERAVAPPTTAADIVSKDWDTAALDALQWSEHTVPLHAPLHPSTDGNTVSPLQQCVSDIPTSAGQPAQDPPAPLHPTTVAQNDIVLSDDSDLLIIEDVVDLDAPVAGPRGTTSTDDEAHPAGVDFRKMFSQMRQG